MYFRQVIGVAVLSVVAMTIAACYGRGGEAVSVDSAQLRTVTAHFGRGSAEPVRISRKNGKLSVITRAQADELHFTGQRFRLSCGYVTVLTDDLNAGQETCKALQPDSDIIISAA